MRRQGGRQDFSIHQHKNVVNFRVTLFLPSTAIRLSLILVKKKASLLAYPTLPRLNSSPSKTSIPT